jgi:hypothetical protein
MDAEAWLSRAKPAPGAHVEVLEALRAEALGDGEPTGLQARIEPDGTLSIAQRWIVVSATRQGFRHR